MRKPIPKTGMQIFICILALFVPEYNCFQGKTAEKMRISSKNPVFSVAVGRNVWYEHHVCN